MNNKHNYIAIFHLAKGLIELKHSVFINSSPRIEEIIKELEVMVIEEENENQPRPTT